MISRTGEVQPYGAEGGIKPDTRWVCRAAARPVEFHYSDDGRMALVKPAETGFEVAGRLAIRDPGKRPTWAHPVVFGGRLYVRYGDRLGVYQVAAAPDVD